jgi:predicted TIM-barrel fold metal-dependent hydrolase
MEGLLAAPMAALDDPEGARVPPDLPEVIDAHVHLFPEGLARAIQDWFDRHGWPIRYRQPAAALVEFLRERGVSHVVALHYSHKPRMARALNRFMAELCKQHPMVTGVATVLPGEPDAVSILEEAAKLGLRGVKLHCHVQCFRADDPAVTPIYEFCAERGWPIVIHAGREPASPAYKCNPRELCSAERIERVLLAHPALKLCVPHLGFDEHEHYARLVMQCDHLWLDTSMVLADYFPDHSPVQTAVELMTKKPERVLFGTDFPGLPFAWDRELRRLAALDLPRPVLERVLAGNARELFAI